jgi:hypothetical protein
VGLDGDSLDVLIVGGAFPQGVYTTTIVFNFAAVPEPGGPAMSGLALLAMVLARRSKRSAASHAPGPGPAA